MDQRFSDMAETFNEQFEHYEAMVRHIRNVRQVYGCNRNDGLTLSECVGRMREDHGKLTPLTASSVIVKQLPLKKFP